MEAARPATAADIDRVAELFHQGIDELRETRGGGLFTVREVRPEPAADDLRRALEDDDRAVWVGTIDDVVIGYASARVERLRDGTTLGVIEDLFVESEARGIGVGEALMGQVLAWGAGTGCTGLDATALPGNRATKNFFEMNGFTARLLVMHHRLEGQPGADVAART